MKAHLLKKRILTKAAKAVENEITGTEAETTLAQSTADTGETPEHTEIINETGSSSDVTENNVEEG
jgi:hypothetical protein